MYSCQVLHSCASLAIDSGPLTGVINTSCHMVPL
jgi:hypothetical protein